MSSSKEIIVTDPAITPVRVSAQAVAAAVQDIAVLEELVTRVLEQGVDYGHIEGISEDVLWDPGSAKIMAAFNVYASHNIISQQDDGEQIGFILETQLLRRDGGGVVATGVGAASTRETRYAYRWVGEREAVQQGFVGEALKTLPKRQRKGQGGEGYQTYRIPNPERAELLNTLLKMAAKRAEQDAVKSLPGVGSALAKLFKVKADLKIWAGFWGEVRRLGFSDEDVHRILGCTSVKDWVAQGNTLEQALAQLREDHQKRSQDPVSTRRFPTASKAAKPPVASPQPPEDVDVPQDIDHVSEVSKIPMEVWEVVTEKVRALGLTDSQVRGWFGKHQLEVSLADLQDLFPGPQLTFDVLSKFLDVLTSEEQKRAKKQEKGIGPAPAEGRG